MRRFTSILVLLLAIAACDTNDDSSTNSADLNGKWKLVSLCGGISGNCHSPDPDYEEFISFSNGNLFTKNENGTIVLETTYIVEESTGSTIEIRFESGESSNYMFSGDKLVLIDNLSREYQKVNR